MSVPADAEPRWRRRPSERPEEILCAALDVFADEGLAGARVEDIATHAGVSKGTLYLYFSGKDELFREALRLKTRRMLEELAVASGAGGDPAERLRRFIEAYWAQLRRPSFVRYYRLLLAELNQFPELMRFYSEEVSGRVNALLEGIVREGVDAGKFADADPGVVARMLISLLIQHAVWAGSRELFPFIGERSDETLLDEIEDFLFGALLARGTTARGGSR
jgi:AcrR family transcriptional regulator